MEVGKLIHTQMRVANHIKNFIINTKDKKSTLVQTASYHEARLQLLQKYFDDLYARNQLLAEYEKENPDEEYFSKRIYEKAEICYIEVVAELSSDIARFRDQSREVLTSSQRQRSECGADHVSQVPRVTLPSFTGDHSEWESFKQRFTSLISSKREYSEVDKLQYLLSSLQGKAAVRLRNIEVVGENFKIAWDLLEKRNGKERRRLETHLEYLIQLKPIRSRHAQDISDLLDRVEITVRALQKLGCDTDTYNHWLVHCIVRCLDSHTKETWKISQESHTGFYRYADLISFLEGRIDSLDTEKETMDPVMVGGSRNKLNSRHQIKGRKSEPTSDRSSFCKKAELCLNCLRKSHTVKNCRSTNRCLICKMPHHTKLHFDSKKEISESTPRDNLPRSTLAESDPEPTTSSGAYTASAKRSILLATATVNVCDQYGKELAARALIDPGAQRSFISERFASQLMLNRRSVSVSILGVGGQAATHARSEVAVTLKSRLDNHFKCSCVALILPKLTGLLPAHLLMQKDWQHLIGLELADPNYFLPSKIDLILGADLYGSILQDGIVRGPAGTPIAQRTVFGWVITGVAESRISRIDSTDVSLYHIRTENSLSQALTKFWEIEEIPPSKKLSPEEEYCEQYFASTYSRNLQGRFIVRLPFSRKESFPDLRDIAVACLRRSEKRRASNPELQVAYSAFMNEYMQLGHMKQSTATQRDNLHYYLPHHGVFRSDTNKIRVVFDASRKTSSGYSLNDILLPGPKLQPDITLVISRWRFRRVAIVKDIIKMFRQFLVHEDDLNWQRLVWRDSADESIKEFVALTLTYGTNCAPYLAMRSMLQLAKDGHISHPLAHTILLHQIYVDDIFLGADDEQQAGEQRDQLKDLLATAGLHLGKWSSSHPNLIQQLHEKDVCNLNTHPEGIVSTLGLKWDTGNDVFRFYASLPPSSGRISKRSVLSATAKLFDPLGFNAPVLIQAKILLQDLWLNKLDWDDPLPPELRNRWFNFTASLDHLKQIQILRWIGTRSESAWHLHGFADASMRACAAVAYAVVAGSNPLILMAKTRVAPVKVETLPRLELCGAALLVGLAKHLTSGLLQAPSSITFWSDSKVVLDWLKSHPSRWPTFIANRVSEITSTFPEAEWRHVRSKDNPADCASRGLTPLQLSEFELWWRGPEWLSDSPSSWPSQPTILTESSNVHTAEEESLEHSADRDELAALEKLSSFSKVIRFIAYCRRWKAIAAKNPKHTSVGINIKEYNQARNKLIQWIQNRKFTTEISCILAGKPLSRRSALANLAPFIDEQGLLRVGGRLHNAPLPYSERHPLILPAHCHFVKLLVQESHRITLHGGTQLMRSVLNRSFWIIRGNRLIKSISHKCVTCIRFRATPLQQQMGSLTADRLEVKRAFQITGLDYAGPFPLLFSKGRGAKSTKGYIAIFICCVTKAVHIEVVSDLTSEAFLAAFSRFTARRGLCSTLISDNGTTFKGADGELQRLFTQTSMFSAEVQQQLVSQQIEWKFIPPRAPHFGGLWEAAVRSFKHHFRRVIGNSTLTFEELATLAAKIEACLNSRPLCPLSNEANSKTKPVHDLPIPRSTLSRWRLISQQRDSFWVRWKKEALTHMQQRNKWRNVSPNLQQGDVVIVTDELTPPARWPLAIIENVHPGKDGLVRVVTLRTGKSSYVRHVRKLLKLLPDDEANAFYIQLMRQST